LRLSSIRSKIIAFSLVATLLPSISMGWQSYRNNLRVLEEKIEKELAGITSQASREMDLWLKERQYEIRVFASSYEVAENLEALSGARLPSGGKGLALGRLGDYLKSVSQRFSDYEEMAVLDLTGTVVATSAAEASGFPLPAGWQAVAKAAELVVGEAFWDEKRNRAAMVLAEPVRGPNEGMLGVLAARVNLAEVRSILEAQLRGGADQLLVITRGGMVIESFPPIAGAGSLTILPAEVTRPLFSGGARPTEFVSIGGREVVGALGTAQRLDWGVIAEKNKATEYAEVARVRNVTVVLVLSLMIGIGAAAYILGLTLVRPLDRLTRGAGKVAGGDLDVDLPVSSGGEVGYLTVVFNRMVARLRAAREEIEATNAALVEKNRELREISITDGLTGLFNRKHLNETLALEFSRASRHGHPVSVLMIDIDYFKSFNDARGHQAGDEVLIGLARILKETLRLTDFAARYGGEEFLVLLPHTAREEAMLTAERIRVRVEEARLGLKADGSPITLSLGVACCPESGTEPDKVIREADIALYSAKRGGRNRVSPARTMAEIESGNPA